MVKKHYCSVFFSQFFSGQSTMVYFIPWVRKPMTANLVSNVKTTLCVLDDRGAMCECFTENRPEKTVGISLL